jgi:hypothetical protein
MTIVELMVAMVVASIALVIVFYMWNSINNHVAVSRYKTQLEKETDRLGLLIVNQIRRSPSIIQWNNHRIQMVHQNGTDTIDYYFNESGLLFNGRTMMPIVPNTRVSDFELSDSNEISGIADRSLFLVFTLSLVGKEKDTATVHHAIHISQTVNKNEESDFSGF